MFIAMEMNKPADQWTFRSCLDCTIALIACGVVVLLAPLSVLLAVVKPDRLSPRA